MTTAITFPAKMTLVHARAVLGFEKISYSQSSSSQNLKLSNILKRKLMLVIYRGKPDISKTDS